MEIHAWKSINYVNPSWKSFPNRFAFPRACADDKLRLGRNIMHNAKFCIAATLYYIVIGTACGFETAQNRMILRCGFLRF